MVHHASTIVFPHCHRHAGHALFHGYLQEELPDAPWLSDIVNDIKHVLTLPGHTLNPEQCGCK
jgi:hypothetical protein